MTPTIPQATPRSLEVLAEHVRHAAPCGWCGAGPGSRCAIHGRGLHLARFVRAYVLGEMTAAEWPRVLGGRDVFTSATIIRAGAR